MPFWKRKVFWDYADFILGAIAASLGGASAVVSGPEVKLRLAGLVPPFALLSLAAKFIAKRLDDRAKEAKESAAVAEKKARDAEVEATRTRAATQAKRIVHGILEVMREEYFKGAAHHEKYMNRITLFTIADADPAAELPKRLVIYARAGKYAESDCWWPVDDDDPTKCRGLAGEIWFYEVVRTRIAECDWPGDADQAGCARYATSTGLTVEEAKRLKVASRALTGTLVMVGGRKWGVLLLDSRKEEYIGNKSSTHKGLMNRIATLVGEALTRAEG